MIVTNGLRSQHRQAPTTATADNAPDGPFIAISLLKFKQKAEYPDDPSCALTGAQAYARYVDALSGPLVRVGARIVYAGAVAGVDVGEVEDVWDMAAVVEYPSLAAARTLLALPEYQAITAHREAGLEGQLALRVSLSGR
jgi:uncharacterized protein (DUF1330 family)